MEHKPYRVQQINTVGDQHC